MDYEKAKANHLGNISRQVGHDVTNKYHYIVSGNDFINSYIKMRNELGYPLMMDSKYRRAVVYNKKGIEKQINETIIKTLVNNIHLLDRMIVEDITSQLNSLVKTADGTFKTNKNINNKSSMNMFINAMVKGLVQGIGHIVEDITNPKDRKKKK